MEKHSPFSPTSPEAAPDRTTEFIQRLGAIGAHLANSQHHHTLAALSQLTTEITAQWQADTKTRFGAAHAWVGPSNDIVVMARTAPHENGMTWRFLMDNSQTDVVIPPELRPAPGDFGSHTIYDTRHADAIPLAMRPLIQKFGNVLEITQTNEGRALNDKYVANLPTYK